MALFGRRTRPTIVLLAVSLVLFLVGVAGVADAATGGNFVLGQSNVAKDKTVLTANVAGPALQLTNTSTETGASALSLTVGSGKAPLRVNSSTKVLNLNADSLDNLDSAALQRRVTGQCGGTGEMMWAVMPDGSVLCNNRAYDAARLGAIEAKYFVLGPGVLFHGAAAIPKDNANFVAATDLVVLKYDCPADLSTNGVLSLSNESGDPVNVFSDNGSTNPEYRQVPSSGYWEQPAAAGGEHITFQVQGSEVTTIDVFSVHRPDSNDCHVQAGGIISRTAP